MPTTTERTEGTTDTTTVATSACATTTVLAAASSDPTNLHMVFGERPQEIAAADKRLHRKQRLAAAPRVFTRHVVEGDGALNTAACRIHSEIHQARPDVVAAARAHSMYSSTWTP